MFLAVLSSHLLPIRKEFLKGRIHHQLLADGMAGQLLHKQILVTRLFVRVICADNAVIVVLELAVVMLDDPSDALRPTCIRGGHDAA